MKNMVLLETVMSLLELVYNSSHISQGRKKEIESMIEEVRNDTSVGRLNVFPKPLKELKMFRIKTQYGLYEAVLKVKPIVAHLTGLEQQILGKNARGTAETTYWQNPFRALKQSRMKMSYEEGQTRIVGFYKASGRKS